MVSSRQEAKEKGESLYFTGQLCKRGHIAPRRASGGTCLNCEQENIKARRELDKQRLAKHYQANAEELKARAREYYCANSDRVKERHRAQYRIDPSEAKRKAAERYRKNGDRLREKGRNYNAKWKKENRDKVRQYVRNRRAMKQQAEGSFTATEFNDKVGAYGGRCHWCQELIDGTPHADHCIPLSRGGSNNISNIVPACEPCNLSKGNKMPWEFRVYQLKMFTQPTILTQQVNE